VTRGRSPCEPRERDIWFVEDGGRNYIVAARREHTQWVKNLRAYDEVAFSVGSRGNRGSQVPRTTARARVIDDAGEVDLAARIGALMQQKYGWSDGLIVEITPAN
jgi:hypothetical protein